MNDPWEDLAQWWLAEVESDPSYQTDVVPLLESLLGDLGGNLMLDVGCGEGRIMEVLRSLGARAVGCDLNEILARHASDRGPSVVGRLPSLAYLRSRVFDGIVAVLVLCHIAHLGELLAEAARVTRPDGTLIAVLNHPVYTAPGSAPIVDPDDGEVLWRWGSYLSRGDTDELAGAASITFYHRPLSHLLNEAAKTGWILEKMRERAITPARSSTLEHQEQFPRLLGIRWRNSGEPFK